MKIAYALCAAALLVVACNGGETSTPVTAETDAAPAITDTPQDLKPGQE